ncbi:MAG: FMN-binding protein [Bacteroidales bacterium]|nr:FMN-binding protein [Bacteroidales bacterium]
MTKQAIALILAATVALGTAMAQQPKEHPSHTRSERPMLRDSTMRNNHMRHHPQRPHDQKPGEHPGHHHHPHGDRDKRAMPPMEYTFNGIEASVARAFKAAAKVQPDGEWNRVLDEKGKLLGYALYSSPAADTIKGWGGPTPVMIAFDTKKRIIGVYALPSLETPRFAQRVAEANLYSSWNGMKAKKALKKEVDTVSGATLTSTSVIATVRAALQRVQ